MGHETVSGHGLFKVFGRILAQEPAFKHENNFLAPFSLVKIGCGEQHGHAFFFDLVIDNAPEFTP